MGPPPENDMGELRETEMTARRYWPGLILGVMLLAACQPDTDSGSTADADSSEAKESEDDSPAIPVETSAATRADIYAMYSGTAPIEADAEAGVIAKVAGEIREILVEEGDEVRSKQILARLDGDPVWWDRAIEAMRRRTERDPHGNMTWKRLGDVLWEAGRGDEAAPLPRPGTPQNPRCTNPASCLTFS